MIYGNILASDAYEHLLAVPAWRMAFEWLRTVDAQTPLGIHELDGRKIYANVMSYATLPAELCRFESHRRYVDLQYTIAGAELIDWCSSAELTGEGGYDEDRDLQFYGPAITLTRVHIRPGHFGIFYPNDAHRPKVSDGQMTEVHKLVVKVSRELV